MGIKKLVYLEIVIFLYKELSKSIKNIINQIKNFVFSILPAHAIITSDSERFILSRINESRILINGEILDSSTELIHLDRLLFGASQYYCFIDPSKSNPNDIIYSFEMVQDEIAKKSGLISDENKLNLNQGFT